jgi:protein-disulfide isomerase
MDVHVFALSTVGLAGVLWALNQIGFNTRLVAWQHWVSIVCVAVLFVTSASLAEAPIRDVVRMVLRDLGRLSMTRSTWLAGAVLLAAIAVRSQAATILGDGSAGGEFARWYSAQGRSEVAIPRGREKVLVMAFVDYQCPACKASLPQVAAVVERMNQRSPGLVRLVRIDYPLERECNPYQFSDLHPFACEAAAAARLADEQGRGPQFEEWLWAHQDGLTLESIARAAHDVGSVRDFDARYRGAIQNMRAAVEVANRLGVSGTPTYVLNGVALPGPTKSQFETAVGIELARTADDTVPVQR